MFEPGVAYELSLGVGLSSVQPPTGDPPPVLRLALTYRDDAGRRHEAGGASATTKGLRSDALTRLTLRVAVATADSPFAGRSIGVLITTAPNNPGHDGHFVFDDVTLRRVPR